MTDMTDLNNDWEDDILALLWAIDVPDSVQNIDENLYTLAPEEPISDSVFSQDTKNENISKDVDVLYPIGAGVAATVLSEKKPEITELKNVQEPKKKSSIKPIEKNKSDNKQQRATSPLETVKQASKKGEKKKQKKHLLHHGVFALKYCITSVCIFAVLLLSTNYSAYLNIIQSYIYEDEIMAQSESLLNSVSAGEVSLDGATEDVAVQKKSKKQRIDELIAQEKKVYQKEDALSMKQLVASLNKEKVDLGITIVPYENRIVIPKIAKNIPLIDVTETSVEWESELNNIFMKELEDGIVRYPWSAKPWELGNSFIFGHSSNFPWIEWDYNDVFSRLGQVEEWDIVVSYYNQKKLTFKIKEKKVIDPDDISILKRDKNRKELTLMTCWPIWTTLNRLILIWELVETDEQ